MLNGEDAVCRVGIDGKRDRCGLIKADMQLCVNGVAVATVDSENQIAINPITAQSRHAIAFVSRHQPFGEEAGEMADATHNLSTEQVVCIAHVQRSIGRSFILILLHSINMHNDAFLTYFNHPFVSNLGTKVIQ